MSKKKIQQIVRQYEQAIPEIVEPGAMAETHRREVRGRRRSRKRKVKQQLKSTDCLSVEQFAEFISFVKAEADAARAKSPHLCRVVINEMLLILMAETDLTPYYVPTSIRELSMFFIPQSGRRSGAEPGGLRLDAKAAGVI
jgi:hypothetical protein